MSAILGVFTAGEPVDEPLTAAMLARMSTRGADRSEVWTDGTAALAVSRQEWELGAGFSGPVLVARDDDVVVAADASLYYRDDLRRTLAERGVRARADTSAHLILAAYRAWGTQCADRLEGDFAFILWDRRERRVFCSRDYVGRRPLHYAEVGGTLVLASSVSAVLAHPAVPADFNVQAIAEAAAGFVGVSEESCYRGIRTLRAGHTLERRGSAEARLTRHWEPPIFEQGGGAPFEEAAGELRALLCRATAERTDPAGPTSVWMSGGWDSPPVFAAGQQALREQGSGENLKIVSISYPEGDPGREDEWIGQIAEHWRQPVHWLDADRIPMFARAAERAALRDEPVGHIYENWNRALMSASQRLDAHVALDGAGGDALFAVSPVYLADLLRTGRWRTLAAEWSGSAFAGSGARSFFRMAVQPGLPRRLLSAAGVLRPGRPLRHLIDRPVPEWFRSDFVRSHGLEHSGRFRTPRRPGESLGARETQWHLTTPWSHSLLSLLSTTALSYGVEIRSPLFDRRVTEFAAMRPWHERRSGKETKRLLRRSMHGLLPGDVLAPRTHRTGRTTGYRIRAMQAGLPALLNDVLPRSVLADWGVIDPAAMRRAAERYLRTGNAADAVNLSFTLETELWLRAREQTRQPAFRTNGRHQPALAGAA